MLKVCASRMFGKQRLESFHLALEVFPAAEGNENRQNALSSWSNHCAFGVARCASMRAEFVCEERQVFQIQIAFADAFVRFVRASRPKRYVALHMSEIVQTDRQTAFDADDIDDVHDGVNARKAFAGNDSAKQSFGRATITRGIFSQSLVTRPSCENGGTFKHCARIGEAEDSLLASAQFVFQQSSSFLRCYFRGDAAEGHARTLRFQPRVYLDNLHEVFRGSGNSVSNKRTRGSPELASTITGVG